jgi:hypothetical protein
VFKYHNSKKEHALKDSLFRFTKNTICVDAKKNLSDFHSKIVLDIKSQNLFISVVMRRFLTRFRHVLGYFCSKSGLEGMIW